MKAEKLYWFPGHVSTVRSEALSLCGGTSANPRVVDGL
jgi:hypothetical protein